MERAMIYLVGIGIWLAIATLLGIGLGKAIASTAG
jgi:hypothetical protein